MVEAVEESKNEYQDEQNNQNQTLSLKERLDLLKTSERDTILLGQVALSPLLRHYRSVKNY